MPVINAFFDIARKSFLNGANNSASARLMAPSKKAHRIFRATPEFPLDCAKTTHRPTINYRRADLRLPPGSANPNNPFSKSD
jgi:hypothetical protein